MLIHAVTSMYRSCHEHESLLLVPKFFVVNIWVIHFPFELNTCNWVTKWIMACFQIHC